MNLEQMSDKELVERVERCRLLLNDGEATEAHYLDLAKECYGWMVTVPDGSPPAMPDTSAWSGQDARRRIEAFVHHSCFELAKRYASASGALDEDREFVASMVSGVMMAAHLLGEMESQSDHGLPYKLKQVKVVLDRKIIEYAPKIKALQEKRNG